jgi:outer membrane protein assembly factor BamE (lipoprotein component of BamABCDE complex)
MVKLFPLVGLSVGIAILSGCAPATAPLATIPERQAETRRLAAGAAQMVKVGMSGADVIAALGSPNVLTNNKEGLETWVYDKISNEYEFVTAQDGGWFFSPRSQQSGVQVQSQRTLLVVVNFNADRRVKNVQYRQTSY